MRSGELVAKRFRIRHRAGAGGMGVVYSADDLETGALVALKVLHSNQRPERFLREAGVLAEVSHPAIVRYVAHGITDEGRVYLAMEWLEGRSLSELIAERRLRFPECLLLLRRVLGGLAVAHERGVVHRDLKPANILLPNDTPATAKLIDFGIARRRFDPRITEHGLLVGTLAYMSPEQARGISEVLPSSDVFSIGSVVYKCMTGDAPFSGGDATAVLAKILLDEPTPLLELCQIPRDFDDLVARMLRKTPEHRPRDARAVLDSLEQLGIPASDDATAIPGITRREQRVVWVVLLGGGSAPDDTDTVVGAPQEAPTDGVMSENIAQAGGRYDRLADGTRVASFVGSGAVGDEALRAARTALELSEAHPDCPIAIASGLGVLGGRAPIGAAIDRGAALLGRARPGSVRIDEPTARLIGPRFEIGSDPLGFVLSRMRQQADDTRKLLGRPTSCVGREKDLATLDALLDECVNEPVARAAIVIAPSGIGKSRLRYEFLRRAKERVPELEIFVGRGESVSSGSPFALLRQALRRAAGVLDGESVELSRSKISERVSSAVGQNGGFSRINAFVAELAGVPLPEDADPSLRAARQNPTLLGDAMRNAWLDYLAAECRRRPLVLVLEDMHWGDIPTASFVDAALSELDQERLFVLALARPEIQDSLPELWARREPVEIRLSPLRRAPARALAREVLGADVPQPKIDRIVELAEGNAFFLEELIRAVAEGQTELPETVLAMMQTRLEAIGSEGRRVLRAASIFGVQFWQGGVAAVLGGDTQAVVLQEELAQRSRRELVSRHATATLEGEVELVFRHATLQEIVYATLTPDDRRLGHRLAGEWLEKVGASDAVALAEHFRRGELPERAARWYLAAAEQALEGTDLAAVVERVARALECNPDAETRGALHYLAADARFWRGEYAEAEAHAQSAVELLQEGAPRWFVAIGALTSAAGTLGKDVVLIDWARRAASVVAPTEEARAAQIVSLVRASHGHLKLGRIEQANALIDRAGKIGEQLSAFKSLGQAWVHHGRSAQAYYAGDVARFVREVEASIAAFDAVGDARTACNARANLGYAVLSLGDLERAEQMLREALSQCERFGMAGIGHYVMHNLGLVLAYTGRTEQGIEFERRAIEEAETRQEMLLIIGAHLYMSVIQNLGGNQGEAEREARIAIDAAGNVPILRAQALAALATALLAQGHADEALDPAAQAVSLLDAHGGSDEMEGRVRSAWIEALLATGRRDEARKAAYSAEKMLRERAEKLGDARLEKSFLEQVPEHARVLARAEAFRTEQL